MRKLTIPKRNIFRCKTALPKFFQLAQEAYVLRVATLVPRTREIRASKNFALICLVEARFWKINGVVNDILVLKMVAKNVFVKTFEFIINLKIS